MSDKDKCEYAAIKADPVKYAAYLEKQRKAEARRRSNPAFMERERVRKAKWRQENAEKNDTLRAAHWAVDNAVRSGLIDRPASCEKCNKRCKPQAHHHKGYKRVNWLTILWLCDACHALEHHPREALIPSTSPDEKE